jgi:ribosomal protein S12 methylthiotransferase
MAELMQLQADISLARLKKLQGKTLDMLVEGSIRRESAGRAHLPGCPRNDGLAIAVGIAEEGDLVPIRITNTTEYDIIGELVKK